MVLSVLMKNWHKDDSHDAMEDWWVYRVGARYYPRLGSYQGEPRAKKVSRTFGFEELTTLRESPQGWYHPHVGSL